ncbi:hypothetical protein B0H11DRAFT_1909080 [Mycena galericulata]|nr:hypothetical protein B0H11DRAFT_1909080 [Mycena galericulata]
MPYPHRGSACCLLLFARFEFAIFIYLSCRVAGNVTIVNVNAGNDGRIFTFDTWDAVPVDNRHMNIETGDWLKINASDNYLATGNYSPRVFEVDSAVGSEYMIKSRRQSTMDRVWIEYGVLWSMAMSNCAIQLRLADGSVAQQWAFYS